MSRRLFKTGKSCPVYQLYFEAGQLPARIIIKKNAFLMAQKNFSYNRDWFSDILKILNDFEIEISEED